MTDQPTDNKQPTRKELINEIVRNYGCDISIVKLSESFNYTIDYLANGYLVRGTAVFNGGLLTLYFEHRVIGRKPTAEEWGYIAKSFPLELDEEIEVIYAAPYQYKHPGKHIFN